MARINAFLKLGRDQECSDIHLAVGVPPLLRMLGELVPVKYRDLTLDELQNLLYEIMSEQQIRTLEHKHNLEFSYHHADVGRFRVSLFHKIGGLGAAFRLISPTIPTLEQLGLPPVVDKLSDEEQGLILVTGATGTGKSTTLAAIVNKLNQKQRLNIITLEDPIEYVHESQRSLLIQREVGTHVSTFADGLRAALREDPDVILVGELRDPDTIMMAMAAAETGHLVLGTLHTSSAAKTLDRIIDAVPSAQKHQAASFLAQHLRGVVSQKLIRSADGRSRHAVVEILMNTAAVSNLILTGKIFQIPQMIQTGKAAGMQTMDQALQAALQARTIDPDDAYLHAVDKKTFQRFVTNPDLLPKINLAIN
jgi:twitching motility protein PilT